MPDTGKKALILCLSIIICSFAVRGQEKKLRPPAYPLIVCTPYFSFWSMADHPGKDWTRHWTGSTMGMASLISIDGQNYRLLGLAGGDRIPVMPLVDYTINPTSTIYHFEASGCRVSLKFLNPILPWDMIQLSKSMGYISWTVRSTDQQSHQIHIYYDCSAEPVVNHASQKVNWSRVNAQGLTVLTMGSTDQDVLEKSGDNLRIDWGYMFTASPLKQNATSFLGASDQARKQFLVDGSLPENDDLRMPRPAQDEWPVMAWKMNITCTPVEQERHLILAYDEGFSAEFLHRKLQPFWKWKGENTASMLCQADKDYDELSNKCETFDKDLAADLEKAGGKEYRDLAVLAYRQAMAAHSLSSDIDGTPFHFAKENFSNGCIATVDVIYPASPIFLLFNTSLLKANLEPIFRYVETGRWKFPFAPHDLGTYPLANGQVYGGGEKTEENQMPVEETGNMLIMMYAIAYADGNAEYAEKYYPILKRWASYLKEKGFDPENQLCTDDFAGHLAHNTNLSVKAILALEAYSRLSALLKESAEAEEYHAIALSFATLWEKQARDKHQYRLAFDQEGSWSQKYNLVWDHILNIHLFDKKIVDKELDWYLEQQQKYGLPLDNRADYTKADWICWTATLAKDRKTFESLITPIYHFLDESPDRVPFTDWYDTKTARQVGFQARSVVGGVFIKMLEDPEVWKKWRR